MVNKRIISLFFLLLSLGAHSSNSIISHRTFLRLKKPGVVHCERTDQLIVDCESSTAVEVDNKKTIDPIKSFNYLGENKVRFTLENKEWEFFGFSKPGATANYVLDFWRKKTTSKEIKVSKKIISDDLRTKKSGRKKKVKKVVKVNKKNVEPQAKVKDLDYRYGSLFLWDNEPLSPEVRLGFNFQRKTPDQLTKIEDRAVEKNDEEAHLQLTLNLFKSMKWGLMYKSIDLFNQKYPQSKNNDFNEFLKLNSLIKERYINGNTYPTKEIIKRLELFTQTSQNSKYNLAINEYLLAYHVDQNNTESILKTATSLYVLAKDNYYPEKMTMSLEFIIQALSRKGDLDKISKLLNDEQVHRFLSKLRIREFETYTKLKRNKSEEVVQEFESRKKIIVENLPKTLLYNLGESYFRQGEYKKSSKMFDKFLKKHSKSTVASKARVRIALCYELLGKDLSLVSRLYKNAIDRGADIHDRFEASIRFVGVSFLRKKQKMSRTEAESFLNVPKGLSSSSISKNTKKLLWLTRLRTLIVSEKLEMAAEYFKSLPLEKISFEDRKVFYGDYTEIILGLMYDKFNEGSHSEVIRLFSEFEKTENTYVPIRSSQYFIEAASYLSLGVEKSSVVSLAKAKKMRESEVYPDWISKRLARQIQYTVEVVRFNLELKNKNYSSAKKIAKNIKNKKLKEILLLKILEHEKNYKGYITKVENFFLNDLDKGLSKDENRSIISTYVYSLIMDGKYIRAKKILMSSINGESPSWAGEKNEFSLLNLIEYFSSPIHSDKEFDQLISVYKKNFNNGKWRGKVDYIVAKRELKSGNEQKGIELLERVIKNKDSKDYLKELAKSELALIKIKQKTI